MKHFKIITHSLCVITFTVITLMSCDKYNYTNDLQKLGGRVEVLEDKELEIRNCCKTLYHIINAINGWDYITKVEKNPDGSYNITFKSGNTVTIRDGHQGVDVSLNLSVAKDPLDGKWYWTLNGVWIKDGNGNRMQAGATDGTNGKSLEEQGLDIPQVTIGIDGNWWISIDGGATWTPTGIAANGDKGKDSYEYTHLFESIEITPNGTIIFTMKNGTKYEVPIILD